MALAALLALAACSATDWRPAAIAKAEDAMRADVSDPQARFLRVQMTGDDRTGQACGVVALGSPTSATGRSARFIVYIDGSAGPFVDNELGKTALDQSFFDAAWQADCIREGYGG